MPPLRRPPVQDGARRAGDDLLPALPALRASRRPGLADAPCGPAATIEVNAVLTAPDAVAVVEPGVLLVADTGAHRVLRTHVRTGVCEVVLGGDGQDTAEE